MMNNNNEMGETHLIYLHSFTLFFYKFINVALVAIIEDYSNVFVLGLSFVLFLF